MTIISFIYLSFVFSAFVYVAYDLVSEEHSIEQFWINKYKEDQKKDELNKGDIKDLAIGGAGLWGLSKLLSKEKTYFIGFFLITWKYLGGGFINFFLTIPISIFFYLYRRFTGA